MVGVDVRDEDHSQFQQLVLVGGGREMAVQLLQAALPAVQQNVHVPAQGHEYPQSVAEQRRHGGGRPQKHHPRMGRAVYGSAHFLVELVYLWGVFMEQL